ncbi:MAG: hypothetical protein AYK19_06730 [Theionarchaea archaeon DG-70-1]|nr:MAG: hypothetical protein AYK19_06730 [Theionarchaea archaeon DG-70-1]
MTRTEENHRNLTVTVSKESGFTRKFSFIAVIKYIKTDMFSFHRLIHPKGGDLMRRMYNPLGIVIPANCNAVPIPGDPDIFEG